mgnify:CR=1 FL=1
MCSIPTMLGAGLSIYGNYVGQKAMAAQAQAQMNAQSTAAITQMNYASKTTKWNAPTPLTPP